MPSAERHADRGQRIADRVLRSLGDELRLARRSADLSQAQLGAMAGLSGAHVAKIELARVAGVPLRTLTVLFALLGHRLSARPYPEGPPVRDVGHARLLARFRALLPPGLRFRTEVPLMAGQGDLRAWDAEVAGPEGSCKIEAETALHDLQATDRRIALKMADGRVDRVILLVSDTKRNRRVLREFGRLISERYPLSHRRVMATLRSGHVPSSGGLVIL